MSDECKKYEDALPKLVVDEINRQIESGDWMDELGVEVASAIAVFITQLVRTEEASVCIARKLISKMNLPE